MADTPLDPRYKNSGRGFYLDQSGIVGRRRRAGQANVPDGQLDFLDIDERGALVVANTERMVSELEQIHILMQSVADLLLVVADRLPERTPDVAT